MPNLLVDDLIADALHTKTAYTLLREGTMNIFTAALGFGGLTTCFWLRCNCTFNVYDASTFPSPLQLKCGPVFFIWSFIILHVMSVVLSGVCW